MINRRRFIQTLAVAAASPTLAAARPRNSNNARFGLLKPDPRKILDLPDGFSYTIVAQRGQEMNDGLLAPGLADGMAAFPGEDGQVILVCNHEIHPYEVRESPFGEQAERFEIADSQAVYDSGKGKTPALGGTTTIHYNPASRQRTHMHMSLIGTENNCAGGPTPWGSWLTCEECFFDAGSSFERGHIVHREKKHGYVFEVPANAMGPVEPVPLKDMGRFEHEATATNPATGVVYLTEDRHQSLLYRFVPKVLGELRRGGQLQALAIKGTPGYDTRNWSGFNMMPVGKWFETTWVDLDEADVEKNKLRLIGHEKGAAVFARGEGITWADGEFVMAATIGGTKRLGQLFTYVPSTAEGTAAEDSQPGQFRLLAEATSDSILRNADNLNLSPWGDLVVCEDTAGHCGLVGVAPDGSQYALADNAYSNSELAGVCFSPDGSVMFVNIQELGLTLAITGPWSA